MVWSKQKANAMAFKHILLNAPKSCKSVKYTEGGRGAGVFILKVRSGLSLGFCG